MFSDPPTNVKFDKVLYRGRVENDAVVHEKITILEFNGNVQVSGGKLITIFYRNAIKFCSEFFNTDTRYRVSKTYKFN